MGNRAVIGFADDNAFGIGIYLHWNGGPESVLAFLAAAKSLGIRGGEDKPYCVARLTQIIGNTFGGTLSLGTAARKELDCNNNDNGLYLIDNALNIVERKFSRCQIKTAEELTGDDKISYDALLDKVLKINKPIFDGTAG